MNPKSNKLILLDNNFSEDPNMIEKAKKIIDRGLEIDLSNGVNIRTMTDEKAYWLGQINHTKQLHIAWDFINDETRVMDGLKTLTKYIRLSNIMCYVLIGFNTTMEEDLYRVYRLQEFGATPYVMVFNDRRDGYYHYLERWCQAFKRKTEPFEEYGPYKNWLKKQDQIRMAI